MSKELEFIKAIEGVLTDFENSEKNISEKNAKDILHMRTLLDGEATFLELHALITDYVVNKMSRKLFGFLPFVIDLKSQILHLLVSAEFDPVKWLHITRNIKSCHSTGDISRDHGIQLPEIKVSDHLACESRFSTLEKSVNDIKESNNFLKAQNTELQKTLSTLNKGYQQIKADLEKVENQLRTAQTEIQKLNLIISQKDEIIFKLTTENESLKSGKPQNSQPIPEHESFKSKERKSTSGLFGQL